MDNIEVLSQPASSPPAQVAAADETAPHGAAVGGMATAAMDIDFDDFDFDFDNDSGDEAQLSPRARAARLAAVAATGNALGIDFDAEDDDAVAAAAASQPINEQPELSLSLADADFGTLLAIFYERLFPFRDFARWLQYGNVQKNYFLHRELSFTLASDAYIRFQSFADEKEMKQKIKELCPVKIDIGAVYNAKPKNRKALGEGKFHPIERELVFDIDMTDYDPIRSCCSGAEICLKCWDFMTVSIKILDRALQDDFGFKHRLWVYSGRRGVHCWVCDDRARKLTAESRRAIVNYLEVVKGGEETARKVNLGGKGLHPSLKKAYEVLNPMFTQRLIHNQDFLTNPEKWKNIVALIPDEELRNKFTEAWTAKTFSPQEKWGQLMGEIRTLAKKKPSMAHTTMEILFQYSYPRLDSNVSIGLNHLLKSPFCVHPKTGRVCIPIDPSKCDTFDPFTAPKLSDIVNEIAVYDLANRDASVKIPDYQKTSLKPHVEYLKRFVDGLEVEAKQILRDRRDEEDKKLQF
ncbi:primase, DNA, polypeptide 1 (49kDa) [Podochytrium sp. JEL0797]|nr:primase, DNA, polypeptide 1 (49kDa) [Podochytrium sp. JEL0797]